MKTSDAIAKVIESCLDDERTLVRERRLVDAQKAVVLKRLADERRRFSEELERSNGPVSRGHLGSWGALLRDLGADLLARTVGRNTGDAIAACRRSQCRIDARYEAALALEWPSEIEAALVAQHERVHAARRELAEIER